MKKIMLATTNPGKIREFQFFFKNTEYELLLQSDYAINSVDETGTTFVENALIKARHAALVVDCPILSDDSGIMIEALNGEPGLYSARYSGNNATDELNNTKVLNALDKATAKDRSARYCCTLVLLKSINDPDPIITQGYWYGEILYEPKGTLGFGYDPIFYDSVHECSAASLDFDIKNKISHRGKALQQLYKKLTQYKMTEL